MTGSANHLVERFVSLVWSAHRLQQQMKVQLTDRIATADRKLARMT